MPITSSLTWTRHNDIYMLRHDLHAHRSSSYNLSVNLHWFCIGLRIRNHKDLTALRLSQHRNSMESACEKFWDLLCNDHQRNIRNDSDVKQTVTELRKRRLPHASAGIFTDSESYREIFTCKNFFTVTYDSGTHRDTMPDAIKQRSHIKLLATFSRLLLPVDYLADTGV